MSKKTILLFAAAALLLLNLVVPPFQNPDEPHHFAAAALYARGAAGDGMSREREEVESGVLRMMDRAEWWRLVGIGRPQPLPKRLTDIEFLMEGMGDDRDFRARLMNFNLWHRLAGMAMRPIAGWKLEKLYFLARAASAFFLIGALAFMWAAFEKLGTVFGRGARLGFFIVLFLPQFLLSGTAVSPDAFVILLGAAFFYGAAALICGVGPGKNSAEISPNRWAALWPAALVVLATIVGIIADRSAFVLAPVAILLGLLFINRENWQKSVPLFLIGMILAIWAVYFAALKYPFAVERMYLSLKDVLRAGAGSIGGILDIKGFARPFWGFTMDGILLKFGWQVFEVSKVVYWVWRFVLIASGIGLGVGLVKWAKARMNDEIGDAAGAEVAGVSEGKVSAKVEGAGGRENSAFEFGTEKSEERRLKPLRGRWLILAVAAVLIQAAGMWAFYGTKGILGQGRYFFPVILPLAFLMAVGLHELGDLVKWGAGQKLVAAVILGEFLLFAISIWTHIIPVFHLILRGPHPGV